MNDTIKNTAFINHTIFWRYTQNTHSIVTAKHIIQKRGFNKYLNCICARVWPFDYNAIFLFSPQKRSPHYVLCRGIYRFKKCPLGFLTLRLPDGSAALRPWKNMRPATCGSDCDLRLRSRCDLRLRRMRDLRPGDGCDLRPKELSYGGGRVIERSGVSIFFPLRKSR